MMMMVLPAYTLVTIELLRQSRRQMVPVQHTPFFDYHGLLLYDHRCRVDDHW